jgi:hypothetical protein
MLTVDYLFALLLIGGLYLMIYVIHWPHGHFP